MIEDAYRKCLLCDADMPAWSEKSVCHKHSSGTLNHRLDETTPAAGCSVAGRGDEARGHQSATTDPAQLIDKARVLRGNLEKAREILADYAAGRPLQVRGDGWLVRFAAEIERLRAALEEIRDDKTASYGVSQHAVAAIGE